MNRVILIGNLTKDVDFTTTNNGIAVAKFTLAVSRRFKNANRENETDFLNIIAWKGLAENCSKFLKKGNKCAVVGNIQTRSYDAQDGNKRYITEIIADEVEFLNTKTDVIKEKVASGELKHTDDDSLPF